MRISIFLITAIVAVQSVGGAPYLNNRDTKCANPRVRKSWTALSPVEKQAYIDAELCLIQAPAKTTLPGVVTRLDDLTVAHQISADIGGGNDLWHVTGQFLHIHRYYMHVHETLLRDECNYTGPLVYWNEAVDAGAFGTSEVLTDFGGPGNAVGDVVEGPFSNIIFNIGPGNPSDNTPHTLNRNVSEAKSIGTGQTYVDVANSKTTFSEFLETVRPGIHADGHRGVGGNDMGNLQSAPNEPLFFLHHTYIDKVWAVWQSVDASRMNDVKGAGNETQAMPATGYVATSDATVLSVYGIIPDATVADVADIQGGYLCYKYDA